VSSALSAPRQVSANQHAAFALVAGVTVLLGGLGCAQWSRIPTPAPSALGPEQEVEVWQGRHRVAIERVTIVADSVKGLLTAPRSGHRPVVFPLAAVDSLRLRQRDTGNFFGTGALAGLGLGVAPTSRRHWAAPTPSSASSGAAACRECSSPSRPGWDGKWW